METIPEIVKQNLCSEGVSKVREDGDDDVDFGKSIKIFLFQKENILNQDGEKLEKKSKRLDIQSFDKTYKTSRSSPRKGEKKYGEEQVYQSKLYQLWT
jgi:hypothetical protein